MSLVDVYGFDFDGATYVEAYESITTPKDAITIYFELDHNTTQTSNNYICAFSGVFYEELISVTLNNFDQLRIIGQNNNSVVFDSALLYTPVNNKYKIAITLYNETVFVVINGVTVFEVIVDSSAWSDWDFITSNTKIGSRYDGQIEFIGILSNVAVYDNSLSESQCISITSGGFDASDSDIIYLETFDNITLGTITGTEQYAIIGQKDDGSLPYSTLNLYIKPFKYNTDFVQKNKTVSGYNSIAPWKFSSELENRLQDDYVQITTNDIMFINKIKSASNTTQTHKNNFNLHIYSDVVGSLDVYGIYESSNEVIATFDVVTGDNYLTVDLNNVNSLEKLGFILPSIDFRLYLDSDIEIECFETGVQVDVEGINVSVEPSIKSYITLDDSIFTNKIKNPLYSYSSDLILTHAEFEQLADFIDISNLYKRRVMVNIDVNETIGNRTAGIPDISNTDFTFASLQTSETTGLYKYVTISYFNSENNKVR